MSHGTRPKFSVQVTVTHGAASNFANLSCILVTDSSPRRYLDGELGSCAIDLTCAAGVTLNSQIQV